MTQKQQIPHTNRAHHRKKRLKTGIIQSHPNPWWNHIRHAIIFPFWEGAVTFFHFGASCGTSEWCLRKNSQTIAGLLLSASPWAQLKYDSPPGTSSSGGKACGCVQAAPLAPHISHVKESVEGSWCTHKTCTWIHERLQGCSLQLDYWRRTNPDWLLKIIQSRLFFLFSLKMSHQLFGFHSQTSPCLAPTHSSLLDVLVVSRWGQERALMSTKPNICLHLNLTHYHAGWTEFMLVWTKNIWSMKQCWCGF